MKILHVMNIPFVLPYILGSQIDYFNSIGSEVHIACSTGVKIEEYKSRWNFKYLELKVNRRLSLFEDLYSIIILVIYIKKNNINVVVGHTPKGALLSMFASFFCRIKKRYYYRHGLMFETSVGFKRKLLIQIEKLTSYLSTNVICVSQSVLDNSLVYNLTKKRKLILIDNGSCNGIDAIGKFNRSNCSSEIISNLKIKYSVKNNNIIIGYIGRLSRDKGINELVQAWDIIKNQNINLRLFLCGPLDERDPVSNEILQKINNDSTITYTGEIFDTECFYSLFTIFILPSFREGFPTVILEASAMNLPIITTKSTGCIDSILENVTGIYTDINPECISKNIMFYIENSDIASIHGINGRKFVLEQFNQSVIWNKLANLYLNV